MTIGEEIILNVENFINKNVKVFIGDTECKVTQSSLDTVTFIVP